MYFLSGSDTFVITSMSERAIVKCIVDYCKSLKMTGELQGQGNEQRWGNSTYPTNTSPNIQVTSSNFSHTRHIALVGS